MNVDFSYERNLLSLYFGTTFTGEDDMQKDEMMKKAHELGFAYERDFRSCAQCTAAAVQDALGIRNDYIFRSAYGLAGGFSNLGDGPCGGYSGGSMMISLFFGRRREFFDGDKENKTRTKELVKRLHGRFIQQYGSVICSKIQESMFGRSYDLWDKKDAEQFEEDGGHTDKCTEVVGRAAEWALELILEEIENGGLKLQDYDFLNFAAEFPR